MTLIEQIKKIFGRGGAPNKANPRNPDKVLDRDTDGKPLRAQELVDALREELERRREERRPLELQWTLNANFLAGNQNCDINPTSGEIQSFAPLREWEEQGVYNRIAPLFEARISALRALSYDMTVRPRTNELSDREKSETATALLRYTQSASDFSSKKDTLLLWSELCGSAFVLSYWDRDGGELLSAPGASDGITPHAGNAGLHEGDLGYGLLTPFEVFPASLYKQEVADQENILIEQIMSVEEIYDLYGVAVMGEEVDTYALTPVAGGSAYGHPSATLSLAPRHAHNSATVLTYFEKPNARHEEGLMMIVAGGELVWYSALPYDGIPLTALRSREVAGQFFGRSVICDLIPLQRAYNGTKNKIHDYIRTTAANPLLVPEGAIPDIEDFATHGLPPGEIVEYDPTRGRPEPLTPAALPAELRYECDRLANDMEYIAGVSQLMVVGETPTGVTSGTAIERLRSIDNSRLALAGENLRRAIRRLGIVWLKIYRRYLSGHRTLLITGENGASGVLCFSADDINSYDLVFDAENELQTDPEVQKENFLSAMKLGLFNDENGRLPREVKRRALRMMKIGDFSDLLGIDELQIGAAERENAALLCGSLPTVGAFDDHALHAETHKRMLLQARFEGLRARRPKIAEAFERHILEHTLLAREAGGDTQNDSDA